MVFHGLRQTSGTRAVEVWDLSKVQAHMGHVAIATTMYPQN